MTQELDNNNYLAFFMMFHHSPTNTFKVAIPMETQKQQSEYILQKYIICTKKSQNCFSWKEGSV